MKNTWLRFAAAAAIAGGMLLSAQEVGSQPAPPAVQQQQRHMAARAWPLPESDPGAGGPGQGGVSGGPPIRATHPPAVETGSLGMFQAVRANDTAKIDQLSAQEANLKGQISALRHQALRQTL
jgi:hypothetical protein